MAHATRSIIDISAGVIRMTRKTRPRMLTGRLSFSLASLARVSWAANTPSRRLRAFAAASGKPQRPQFPTSG